ncbi:MAG: Gx transporter family protein [Lachnospiraceae bacterium]|nr:Gx transporter family protein [Lachnospiraceae bacterium]
MSKDITKIGIFIALAMAFGYLEVLIPFSFGIPGVKLGVANIVVVTGLFLLKPGEVFTVSILRIMMMGFLFGNGISILYSLAGGLLSFVVMLILKKTKVFSITGISVAGGVFHNLGQIMAAALILHNRILFYYLPVLIIAGVITGSLIGLLSDRVVKTLRLQDFDVL